MAIHGTGSPLSMSEIQTEFGGSNPISMSEYYAGGANVPAGTSGNGGNIPSSGAINFNIFYTSAKVTRVAIALQISSTTQNYNIYSNRGGSYSAGQSDVTLTVQAIVGSSSTGSAAIDTGNQWTSGDTIKIINNNQIVGAGGAGGRGGQSQSGAANNGSAGGNALNLGFATTVQNNGGFIRGAGGGGGGGAGDLEIVQVKGGTRNDNHAGGGGGGAQGQNGGAAGAAGTLISTSGNNSAGQAGQAGSISGAGNGGSGGGSGKAGNGGAGGGFGTNGQNGQGREGSTAGAGAGGASGKAVNLNSNSLTWEDGNTNVQGAVS